MAKHTLFVFDFETGGFEPKQNPAEQIAIACVDPASWEIMETYSTYIKPYDSSLIVTPGARKVTGITDDQVHNGTDLKEVVKHMIALARKYTNGRGKFKPVLSGHNIAEFDMKYLGDIFSRCGEKWYDYFSKSYCDTQTLARCAWPDQPNKLSECCARVGIDLIDAHDAFNDVKGNIELIRVMHQRIGTGVGGGVEQKRVRDTFRF